ncbi:hypothetical protein [Pseudonocardia zijingensis]|uniref:Uncharacterized protein n=1 Tax=Pseudonocardia zijingensis TaxID=153376 RepID=A0ABP3YNP6_9PSEU
MAEQHTPPRPGPVGDPAPSAVWTFGGGLIVASVRIHDALATWTRKRKGQVR